MSISYTVKWAAECCFLFSADKMHSAKRIAVCMKYICEKKTRQGTLIEAERMNINPFHFAFTVIAARLK